MSTGSLAVMAVFYAMVQPFYPAVTERLTIHDILKNNTSLSKEKKQSLENLYSLLDEVISNPEMHYKKASEKCFKDGISAFVDAFPGGSNVKAAIKVVQKIRQATEYKSKEEKEKTGFDDEFFKQHPNYET